MSSESEAQRVGVVGAGTLGRTVVLAALGAGSPVTVLVRGDTTRCAGVRNAVVEAVRRDVERGRLDLEQADTMLTRLSVTPDIDRLQDSDAVIESVLEDVATKRAVRAAIEQVVAGDTLIASTTSTIPAAALADGARHPERIVVAHYVWPAHRMPLVEVALHAHTSPAAVAALDRLLNGQGKAPVRVRDRPGFLITRALFAYWNATLELLAAGYGPKQVDAAHLEWGWPMGPAEVMRRTGLASVARIHAGVAPALGYPFPMLSALGACVERTLASGRPAAELDFDEPTLSALRAVDAPAVRPSDVIRHTVGALAAETDRAVAEGVVGSWAEAGAAIDLAYGFPAGHGGLDAWWRVHGRSTVPQPA